MNDKYYAFVKIELRHFDANTPHALCKDVPHFRHLLPLKIMRQEEVEYISYLPDGRKDIDNIWTRFDIYIYSNRSFLNISRALSILENWSLISGANFEIQTISDQPLS